MHTTRYLLRKVFGLAGGASRSNGIVQAIGDCHAYPDALRSLLEQNDDYCRRHPGKAVTQIFLGDYGSKGPDTRETYNVLCAHKRRDDGYTKIFLKGDHEALAQKIVGINTEENSMISMPHFFDHGGLRFLQSYGVSIRITEGAPAKINEGFTLRGSANKAFISQTDLADMSASIKSLMPDAHKEFLSGLRDFYETDTHYFCHAGIEPGVPLNEQRQQELIGTSSMDTYYRNVRQDFIKSGRAHEKIIVHAHTIEANPQVRWNRIGIDSGLYRHGVLTGLIIDGPKEILIQATTSLPLNLSQVKSYLPQAVKIG